MIQLLDMNWQKDAEILVDVICTYHERLTDPRIAWEAFFNDRKSFIFLYAFASLVGGGLANVVVSNSGSFSACTGRDMCYCVNNGLVENGVRETYCKLIYPNSSGMVPPQWDVTCTTRISLWTALLWTKDHVRMNTTLGPIDHYVDLSCLIWSGARLVILGKLWIYS